ncbi:hypothetical protein GCM10023187_52740 [Nibrella viscosa]|uniref:Caspase family p20 domain-containing protein n=1 Tax=Nibrella viscosa TaxID=1084524 RepID=A0ABP8KYX0_9BACT
MYALFTHLFLLLGILLPFGPCLAQSRSIKIVGGTAPAGTERRLALVVGNKDYQHVRPLKNPLNDAQDMSRALETLGFEVITLTNTTFPQLTAGLNRLKDKLTTSDVVVIYYSGHGLSYAGKNYLLPIDADIRCLEQVEEYGISLNRILSDISARRVQNSFVFLDACRNLPNLQVCDKTSKDLVAAGGLVRPTNNPRGSMVVYATREGSTADDNVSGRNGLFTEALLQYLLRPNWGIRSMLDETTKTVVSKSGGEQRPGRYDELEGDFVFVLKPAEVPLVEKRTSGADATVTRTAPAGESVKSEVATARPQKFLELPFAELVYVPGGTFQMGDTRNEGYADETPVHTVTVSPFLMGKYEVTQRQWEDIMGSNPSRFKDCPDCPVEQVSWEEVQVFLQKLNARTGGKYRLPTEAEWEYAAGGGAVARRSRFGNGQDVLDPAQANFDGSEQYKQGYSVAGEYRGKTVRVGSFGANPLGLYDMAGNVWEWCQDWFGSDYYARSSSHNPAGPATGTHRVLRGGSWLLSPRSCRSAYRSNGTPGARDNDFGFRVVSPVQ